MTREFSPKPEVKASVEICEEIQRKVFRLLEEFERMEKQDLIDLSALQVGEKVAAIFRAGFSDVFGRRMLLLVLSQKEEGGFGMRMSWRTLRKGLTFNEQTNMPNLPDDLTSILLGQEQLPSLGDEIEFGQVVEGEIKWWEWQIMRGERELELSMGYAEALLSASVVMSEVGSRAILSMFRTGQLERGKVIGPKPRQTYDLELPNLPFAPRVLGRNLSNQAIFWVGRDP